MINELFRDSECHADNLLLSDIITRSCGKAEIEELVRLFIKERLDYTDSGTLFVLLKQLKYAVEFGIEELKEQAFSTLGDRLGGLQTGEAMGHEIRLCYPREWHYSSAVDALKERQKKELTELQEREKAERLAKQMLGKGRATIYLRA